MNKNDTNSLYVRKESMEKAYKFAADRLGGSKDLYEKRGEKNLSKIEQDIITGAVAELAVYNFFRRNKIKTTKPDMTIYEKKKKSFSADLRSTKYNIHVKAQSFKSANKYGASWLFQKEDKLFKEPSDNELIVFCLVDDTYVNIEAIVSTKQIVEHELIEQPMVYRYQFTKNAIYLNRVILEIDEEEGVEYWKQRLQKASQKK